MLRRLKSLGNLLGFLLVLAAAITVMQRLGMIDLGSGRAEVIDGDSLRLNGTEIRLHAIDAPEYRQTCRDGQGRSYPCGRRATEALRALTRRGDIACTSIETDRYGRAVSTCTVEGQDVAREQVRQGWALAYRRHGAAYASDEAEARKAKRGLWAGKFEEPEDYRAATRRREGSLAGSDEAEAD